MKNIAPRCLLCNEILHNYNNDMSILIEHLRNKHPCVNLHSLQSSISTMEKSNDSNSTLIKRITSKDAFMDKINLTRESTEKVLNKENLNLKISNEPDNTKPEPLMNNNHQDLSKFIEFEKINDNVTNIKFLCKYETDEINNNYEVKSPSEQNLPKSNDDKIKSIENNAESKFPKNNIIESNSSKNNFKEISSKNIKMIDKGTQTNKIELLLHEQQKQQKQGQNYGPYFQNLKILNKKFSKEIYKHKYVTKNPFKPISIQRSPHNKCKRKLYKTSLEKWRPGKNKIFCPLCGKLTTPVIRQRVDKETASPFIITLMLSCWPLCFLSCLKNLHTKEYLYCSICYYYLGMYDYKTECIYPNFTTLNNKVTVK